MRELPWSANLHILSKTKRAEEREFYLKLAVKNPWPVREVARQIEGALFERAALSQPRLSTPLRELHPQAEREFKDAPTFSNFSTWRPRIQKTISIAACCGTLAAS